MFYLKKKKKKLSVMKQVTFLIFQFAIDVNIIFHEDCLGFSCLPEVLFIEFIVTFFYIFF